MSTTLMKRRPVPVPDAPLVEPRQSLSSFAQSRRLLPRVQMALGQWMFTHRIDPHGYYTGPQWDAYYQAALHAPVTT